MVLKLTHDKRVMAIAGQPAYCKTSTTSLHKSRMTGETALGSLISFTFGPTGEMYIAEVDDNNVNRYVVNVANMTFHSFLFSMFVSN